MARLRKLGLALVALAALGTTGCYHRYYGPPGYYAGYGYGRGYHHHHHHFWR